MAPAVPPPAFPAPTFAAAEAGALAAPPPVAPSFEAPTKPAVRPMVCRVDSRSTSSGTATPLSHESTLPSGITTPMGGEETPAGGLMAVKDSSFDEEEESAEELVAVKNTFINVAIGRCPSLDGFFEERLVRSCPATRCPSAERLFRSPARKQSVKAEQAPSRSPTRSPARSPKPGELLAMAGAAAAAVVAPERCTDAAESEAPAAPTPAAGAPGQKQVLRLGDVLQQPEIGSAELPTAGSASHRFGGCKPCAFAHTKGCENGINCQFCHLCEPGEKKRRQKQRVARQPEARPEARPAVSPVVCRPMMSPVLSRPVMSPAAGPQWPLGGSPVATPQWHAPATGSPVASPQWQGRPPAANLRMAAVFRLF